MNVLTSWAASWIRTGYIPRWPCQSYRPMRMHPPSWVTPRFLHLAEATPSVPVLNDERERFLVQSRHHGRIGVLSTVSKRLERQQRPWQPWCCKVRISGFTASVAANTTFLTHEKAMFIKPPLQPWSRAVGQVCRFQRWRRRTSKNHIALVLVASEVAYEVSKGLTN